MNSIQDCYTLNNGMKLPCVGFGTYQTINGDGKAIILDAIRAGYRFFDAASLYETERALGAAIKESGLPREDFIIETKLWIDEMGYENAKKALAASLERLQMDYVDLYMIHWPRQTGADDENWKALDLETWRAMEEMVDEGKVRALGCSNFLPHQTGCRSARTASGLFAGGCRRILQSERYRSDGVESAWQRPRKCPRR